MEIKQLELKIKKELNKITLLLAIIITIVYVFYSKKYEHFSLYEDYNLRSRITSLENKLNSLNNINQCIFENAHLIGKRLTFLDELLPIDCLKIIIVSENLNSNKNNIYNPQRLLLAIKTIDDSFLCYSFIQNSNKVNTKDNMIMKNSGNIINYYFNEAINISKYPVLLVISEDNRILVSLTLDGEKTEKEYFIIKEYIQKILKSYIDN